MNPRIPAILALVAILLTGSAFTGGLIVGRATAAPSARPAALDDPSRLFVAAARAVEPSVPHLIVTRLVRYRDPFEDFFSDEFAQRFFRRRMPERVGRETSMGSGVVIDAGTILTNAHVVKDAHEVVARFPDGRAFKARRVAVDDRVDLAVVTLDEKELPVAPLGNSDEVEVGQWVLAIGNPFGLEHTVTAGIISARRSGETEEGFIQTDAPINPGNSGGPLVDLKGRVIGINTAIYSRTGGYQGIGFAIPINTAKQIVRRLTR
jgi:serine protease Do